MNTVIAIDSFKGSLTSLEAGNAVKEAIQKVDPNDTATVYPLADGGEGTVEALSAGLGGSLIETTVTGPIGRPVLATYCILPHNKTAVIEMSAAAGITLLSENEKNPFHTTTYGVGEIIVDAIKRGCRNFIVGIGGSATNDGGVGMLQALGFDMLDDKSNSISFGAKGLERLASISAENCLSELSQCTFRIACDVTNPLCGENGCSAVYGPQKGASPVQISKMDHWLANYAKLVKSKFPFADDMFPGAGAAGGLGFAFLSFLNATLLSGIQIVLDELQIEKSIQQADIVVTGEGKLDGQTVSGKAPIGLARLAKRYNKKVIAFCGCATEDATLCNENGIDAFFPILQEVTTLENALSKKVAYNNLKKTAEQVFRLIKTMEKEK